MALMRKEQILILLTKIQSYANDKTLTEWPADLAYEFSSSNILSKIQLTTKKCVINMWLDYSGRKINIEFRVGNNVINSSAEIPFILYRWTSPVWRQWRKTSKIILNKHVKTCKMKHMQEVEKQSEIFNNLFYSSFPEEIDNIFFNPDDD